MVFVKGKNGHTAKRICSTYLLGGKLLIFIYTSACHYMPLGMSFITSITSLVFCFLITAYLLVPNLRVCICAFNVHIFIYLFFFVCMLYRAVMQNTIIQYGKLNSHILLTSSSN